MADKGFEQALKELEDIVSRLEKGDLPLEEALKLFEEGVKLSRHCHKKLDEAQRKVEILLSEEGGQMTTTPFDPDEGVEE